MQMEYQQYQHTLNASSEADTCSSSVDLVWRQTIAESKEFKKNVGMPYFRDIYKVS